MEYRTVAGVWYEAVMIRGYGARLDGNFSNKREAKAAIKASKEKQKAAGYKPSEYFIVMCSCVRMIDKNGDTISETIVKTRV